MFETLVKVYLSKICSERNEDVQMGDLLYIEVRKEQSAIQQEAYWWPLIFEAMRRGNFSFTQRNDKQQRGIYFSAREMDNILCRFEELWNKLYKESDQRTVLFWYEQSERDAFHIEVSVSKIDRKFWEISLTIADGYLNSHDPIQMYTRINSLLNVGLILYDLCFPSIIKMHWDEEHNGADLLQTKVDIAEIAPISPLIFAGHELQWKRRAFIREHAIFIVDPMPVHIWGGTYAFTSLL